ncbi:FMRF-Like Peptide [Caenorhabditis elegans]|uniref:FMRF-Like Peptide n=1 Tax=Caenorhabditis elegans TaxID=6239 RepID=G5EG31_CAEEL|nr:FMRF-Like Peptide [Caenorhabditis elegans]AAC08941.1 FMRFamide-like peptide 4 [Caenorhabditis elegans]CAA88434.1 FMRF-Like Peptide [Caenorhabditis elegans]|eukprot:NP_496173.1 FMRF-Like Peptide [Caenorhabditis elegans]
MNAFSSSLKTFIFSLLFATLLALTAAHPPSSGEEIAEQEEKNIASPDELIPEIVEQQNFWPPVHLRGLRSSNGKPTFIRFGKRASPSFIRFGK